MSKSTKNSDLFHLEIPIIRQTLPEIVSQRIGDMVTSRALKPGDQIPPERELADILNVSRTSVREGVKRLAALGVIETRQGGGAYISSLDSDALLKPIQLFFALEDTNIKELYEARTLLEGDIASRAAVNISDEALKQLQRILTKQKDCLNNPKAFRLSDYQFHETIWAASGNMVLKRIGKALNQIGLEFRRRASENPQILQTSFQEHQQLFNALQAGDAEQAKKIAEQHMQSVYYSTVTQ